MSARLNRLAVKLTAAFIVVAVVGVGLVSYLANRATTDEFASYVSYSATAPPPMLNSALAREYAQAGDWLSLQPALQQLAELTGAHLVVSDQSGRVLADSDGRPAGRVLPETERAGGVPIVVDGRTVGLLYYLVGGANGQSASRLGSGMMGGMMRGMAGPAMGVHMADAPGAAEAGFLQAVNSSLWTAGALAAVLAAALGLVFVRQITRPLRALTEAASRIAKGDLAQRVAVRSGDEVGELAVAFNAMADSLAKNEQLRRQLVADIAHELRTPLAVIQGNLEGMRDGVVPATPEKLASVHEESLLLARLVNDLRELSLAEAGQLPLQRTEMDLGELAQRAVEKVQSQAASRAVAVRAELPAAVPPVPADADRIGQVLHNLLDNALRHTPAGGEVAVTVSADDGKDGGARVTAPSVVVRVSDTGSGIPAEDLPYVFDRFYRADKSRSRASGGSGIGLAVVKQLVEAHGGRVWATSEPGKGSIFCFVLPASPPDAG